MGTETRKDAASALGAASAAVHPARTGVGGKIAIAGAVLRLARRYPLATLVLGGVALAVYVGRHRVYSPPVTRH